MKRVMTVVLLILAAGLVSVPMAYADDNVAVVDEAADVAADANVEADNGADDEAAAPDDADTVADDSEISQTAAPTSTDSSSTDSSSESSCSVSCEEPPCTADCEPDTPICTANCEPTTPVCTVDCEPDTPGECIQNCIPIDEPADECTTADCFPVDGGGQRPVPMPVAGRSALPFTGIGDVVAPLLLGLSLLLGGVIAWRWASTSDAFAVAAAQARQLVTGRSMTGYENAMRDLDEQMQREEYPALRSA